MATLIVSAYDDVLYDKRLKRGWGFSCYIEHNGKKILFDTGSDSYKLFFNLEKTEVNLDAIDCVVISHNHWDHTGGLSTIVRKNKKPVVYTGSSFSTKFTKEISDEGAKCIRVNKILPLHNEDIWVGPELKNNGIPEIAMALKYPKGLIIITGCAHPGITHVVKEYQKLISEKIYLVLGGFHLYDQPVSKIKNIVTGLKELNIEKVAPCHCTGIEGIKLFQQEFKNNFIEFWAGSKIKID